MKLEVRTLEDLKRITSDNCDDVVLYNLDWGRREWELFVSNLKKNKISLQNWDVSNVTDMLAMFADQREFNQDISSWDVTNVTRMDMMFWKCMMFNQDISSWDVSSVKTSYDMFTAFSRPGGTFKMKIKNKPNLFTGEEPRRNVWPHEKL